MDSSWFSFIILRLYYEWSFHSSKCRELPVSQPLSQSILVYKQIISHSRQVNSPDHEVCRSILLFHLLIRVIWAAPRCMYNSRVSLNYVKLYWTIALLPTQLPPVLSEYVLLSYASIAPHTFVRHLILKIFFQSPNIHRHSNRSK